MLDVELTSTDNEFTLKCTGHCNSAPKGEDLVCSAASILTLTVAQILQENEDKLDKPATIDVNEGDTIISWKAKPEYDAAMRNIAYFAMTGFKLLYHNNPKYINLK